MRSQQLPVHLHLPLQGVDLGVSAFDQSDTLANHARAFASKGCESLVLICEISAGSGVTGKLGVTDGLAHDLAVALGQFGVDIANGAAQLRRIGIEIDSKDKIPAT